MNASELLTSLTQKGVKLWVNNGKLNIRSPKGVVTSAVQAELTANKSELLALLERDDCSGSKAYGPASMPLEQGVSLYTIGRIIGGFGERETADYVPPVISSRQMAQRLIVTFRSVPRQGISQSVLAFREALQRQLQQSGVTVEPWEAATRELSYRVTIPIINRKLKIKTQMVRAGVNAVIDVERPPTLWRTAARFVAEKIYQIYRRFFLRGRKLSVMHIAQMISWAEDHAAKFIENPTNTQVIVITDLDPEFANHDLPYRRKINIGLNTLIRTFSELVIGVSESKLSILNMNLSDSVFIPSELETFVNKSLIPKIFVPILPLPMSRFELGQYDPQRHEYAHQLIRLGQNLVDTCLFPPGFKLSRVIKRQSYRDIVDTIVNGRTGVSYGFVAYIEPPQYIGAPEIDASTWHTLSPVEGFSPDEIRQNPRGRRYLRTKIGSYRYKQIPDVWLVSSRSGANKTDLSLTQDVLRIGLTTQLLLQSPFDIDIKAADIKPSYDIYVMVSIALSAALFTPSLVEKGAPIVHFHGYPAAGWFQQGEHWAGVQNPSVPCGTYESGVFNFLSMSHLSNLQSGSLKLAALVEPDHGTNIIASDLTYLLDRLAEGTHQGQIELGGRHFASLKADSFGQLVHS